jgi:hypothetical protein
MDSIEKIMQIIALLPEEKQSDVHYKIMMRT